MASRKLIGGIEHEFSGASLGDARREARLSRIVGALESQPGSGFPKALKSEAELEAFYRFINNDGFSAEDIMAPHVAATFARARGAKEVIIVHDTTSVEFDSPVLRAGLGWMTGAKQGFFAHVSLALTSEGIPLGVLNVDTLTRTGDKALARKRPNRAILTDANRESIRWLRGVAAVEDAREEAFEAVHVTDAEGDFFELMATMHEDDARFVIRAGQLDRLIGPDGSVIGLRQAVDDIRKPALVRDVELTERVHRRRKPLNLRIKHPARNKRVARLAMGTTRVTMRKTRYSSVENDGFFINVVRVWEVSPTPDEPAVEWVLFTTEDVSTPKAIERVVDIYRLRWTIEEYFKALKTSCGLERRQIESYEALRNVLALFVPIAYRLLLLRALQRRTPNAPARLGFTELELYLMAHSPSNKALPPPVSLRDGLTHLARLGGHLKNNGEPGWLTLGRGYEELLTLQVGWRMAVEAMRSDQS